jgi:hypothetical protein
MKKVAFYKKTLFWENVKKTIAVFAAPGVVGLHKLNVEDGYMYAAGAFALLGAVLAIWMIDNDKNGIVDLFE